MFVVFVYNCAMYNVDVCIDFVEWRKKEKPNKLKRPVNSSYHIRCRKKEKRIVMQCACKLGICTKAVKWRIVCVACWHFHLKVENDVAEVNNGTQREKEKEKKTERKKNGTTFVECNLYRPLWSLIWLNFTHSGIYLSGNKSEIQKNRWKKKKSWRTKMKMRRWNRRQKFLHSMKGKFKKKVTKTICSHHIGDGKWRGEGGVKQKEKPMQQCSTCHLI